MADLDISANLAQWLTAAFMLTMAVVIPVTGYLLQRLNTRRQNACDTSMTKMERNWKRLLRS